MADFRLTFMFNLDRQGWSETWYYNGAAYANARAVADTYVTKRMQIMSAGADFVGCRISDEAILQDSTFLSPGKFTGLGLGSTVDQPNTAWQFRVEASEAHRRAFFARGTPDSLNTYALIGGGQTFPTQLTDWEEVMQTFLTSTPFRVRARDYAVETSPTHGITAIGTDTAGHYQITCAGLSDEVTAAGQQVVIAGVEGYLTSELNGISRVQAIAGDVYTLTKRAHYAAGNTVSAFGTARKLVYTYPAVTKFLIQQLGSHKTGRAFFVPRGRARARP